MSHPPDHRDKNTTEPGRVRLYDDANTVQSCVVLCFLLFGDYILLTLAQKLQELFPRSEPEGTSTIDFLHAAGELLIALLPVRSDAH